MHFSQKKLYFCRRGETDAGAGAGTLTKAGAVLEEAATGSSTEDSLPVGWLTFFERVRASIKSIKHAITGDG